jgi:hypothetical protein
VLVSHLYIYSPTFFLQGYKSRRADGFHREQFHCPFRKKCGCLFAISVKTYRDKAMCFVSGEHTLDSHKGGKGLLTVKQQVSIRTAVRCAPLQTGSAVLANLKNFSPDRRVRGDKRSKSVLDRMVRRGRKKLMAERTPGYRVYETKGAMTKLAKSLSLKTAIKRHNDPADSYHMDAHQVVCLGFQFKDGVRFMVLSTPHLIVNMARAIQCGWQIQGHWDGAFNWCNKDYGMLAFGLNNMGARYNPVTITIANSESRTATNIHSRQPRSLSSRCTSRRGFAISKSVPSVPPSRSRQRRVC